MNEHATCMTRMTRRDYELLARVIRETIAFQEYSHNHAACYGVRELACRMADALAARNPRFDRKRFMAACLMTDLTKA